MYVQVITYSLEGISEEEYLDVAHRVAPRVAGVPGLLAKIWLENPGGNRYGGIYFWDDLESMDRFSNSDLFEGGTEEFTDLVAEEFGILENLTAMTQPVLEILEPRRPPAPPAPTRAAAAGKARKTTPPAAKRTPAPATGPPPAKKAPATKAAARTAVKKAPVEKAAVKKAPVKKAAVKKAPAKKAAKAATTRAATKAATKKATKQQGG